MSNKTDIIERGVKDPAPLGALTLIGLRALDPFVQYSFLSHGAASTLLTYFNVRLAPLGAPAHTGLALIDSLQLSPYRLALLAMTTGATAKHIAWKLFIAEETMTPSVGAMVGVFNLALNTTNILLFIAAATSPATTLGEGRSAVAPGSWPPVQLALGGALCAAGLLTELVAEWQRKAFKAQPANKGKPFTGGLFGLARHINYGAYTTWRAGFALAAGGWLLGAGTGAFFAIDFATRAIPSLDAYCRNRYADMWTDYCEKTRWKLFPFIY